ncbi:MAG: BCCT family transporter, partial [Bacteroidia bacterium]|nr:BCCT family transporter [Bacteroidia bacterium]
GMGAGILLRAVQEPVYMYLNPPVEVKTGDKILALEYTFYQWGFTAWAFYGLFALIIGFHIYNRNKPSLSSSAFDEILKNRFALVAIDILVIVTTVFGLIAAIGLGTTQITGGMEHLISKPLGFGTAVSFTILICTIAFVSVWKGIDKGIKRISNINIAVALLLLVFVFSQGKMAQLMSDFMFASGNYIIDLIPMSLALGNFDPGDAFLTDWTYYYWAFWLAWAPFTGIFIARISKGRTIRQFLLGVLLIPSLGTFIWFTAFGGQAIDLINSWPAYQGEFDNVFSSIFRFFDQLPLNSVTNIIVVILLIGFLITSVDSAVYVLSMFTDKGEKYPKRSHRLIWSAFVLIFTISLIWLGYAKSGINVLNALQKLLIITSLPFSFLLLLMSLIFIRDLFRKR